MTILPTQLSVQDKYDAHQSLAKSKLWLCRNVHKHQGCVRHGDASARLCYWNEIVALKNNWPSLNLKCWRLLEGLLPHCLDNPACKWNLLETSIGIGTSIRPSWNMLVECRRRILLHTSSEHAPVIGCATRNSFVTGTICNRLQSFCWSCCLSLLQRQVVRVVRDNDGDGCDEHRVVLL